MREEIAAVLLDIGAVGFSPEHPITFKSGIRAPVYVDNRRLPFHPAAWAQVIAGLASLAEGLTFDAIAGIEAAGIPHSAALGYHMGQPSLFVRKATKAHGTAQRIEGGKVSGRTILLVEDLVTTGGSSLSGVGALREAGAEVHDCLAITSYGFDEAARAFAEANVHLHTLTDFPTIWRVARWRSDITRPIIQAVEDWWRDPHHWTPPAN